MRECFHKIYIYIS